MIGAHGSKTAHASRNNEQSYKNNILIEITGSDSGNKSKPSNYWVIYVERTFIKYFYH